MEKLRNRVWKGIPDSWRGEIWKRLLQVDDLKAAQVRDAAICYLTNLVFYFH